MTNMEINIGLQVTKQTPVNKGDFKQLMLIAVAIAGFDIEFRQLS